MIDTMQVQDRDHYLTQFDRLEMTLAGRGLPWLRALRKEAFARFDLHGAFRSREVTGEAVFALMRLLRYVGHPTARRARDRDDLPRHSHVWTFRRLPRDWPELWRALLRGASRAALEQLSLRLLDHDGACARRAAIHADLQAVERFFEEEASPLARAIAAGDTPAAEGLRRSSA